MEASRGMADGEQRPPDEASVTFRAVGPGPPLVIRVRRMLKHALRECGLRCTSVNSLKPHDPGEEDHEHEQAFRTPGPGDPQGHSEP